MRHSASRSLKLKSVCFSEETFKLLETSAASIFHRQGRTGLIRAAWNMDFASGTQTAGVHRGWLAAASEYVVAASSVQHLQRSHSVC